LREPQPLPVLANPGFELARQGDVLPGWEHLRSAGVSVQVVPEPTGSGGSALCVQSEGPVVWVRSNPFPTPKTGRVALWVSLKTENPNEQPPLQLAVEGRLDGDPDPYYRAAGVGALAPKGDTVEPLTTAWKPFVVVVNNLPSTGLTDLRVAIDLMGKGKVWVDDVQVFDLWFDKSECNELLKKIARANWNLGKGEVTQCERILQGYWPQFLRHDVPLNATPRPAVPVADASRQEPTPPGKPPAEQPSASTSWLKKIVPKAPKLPTWFR
jgi:hypothetical protein